MAEQPGLNGNTDGRSMAREVFSRARRVTHWRPLRMAFGQSSLANRAPGQIVALFALSLVAMVPVLALIVDGGNIYVQRRTTQNAADAAALAGTLALIGAPQPGISDTTVATEVCKYLTLNSFGTTPTATASFVDVNDVAISAYPVVLPANCIGVQSNPIPAGAAGVKVDAQIYFSTYLAGVALGGRPGVANVTSKASATVQAATVTAFNTNNAPFIICGVNTFTESGSPATQSILLMSGATVVTPPQIDPLAIGQEFDIHDSTVQDCGGGSSFKGRSNPGNAGITALPADIPWVTGNIAGPTRNIIDGISGCASWQNTTVASCVMVIPIADYGTTPPSQTMHSVLWGAFLIKYIGANQHSATLLKYNVGGGPQSTFTWTFGSAAPGVITSMALRT